MQLCLSKPGWRDHLWCSSHGGGRCPRSFPGILSKPQTLPLTLCHARIHWATFCQRRVPSCLLRAPKALSLHDLPPRSQRLSCENPRGRQCACSPFNASLFLPSSPIQFLRLNKTQWIHIMVSAKPQINQSSTARKREWRNECYLWQGKENQRANSMLSWNKEILGILFWTLLCF